MQDKYFYRLHRSCRPTSPARIRQLAGAANTTGWPDKVRDGLLQRLKKTESPPSAANMPEFRTRVRPQPSFTAPLVRPPLGNAEDQTLDIWRAGRTSGRGGRLRSSMCSKLRCTRRSTRRLHFRFLADGRRELNQASQLCPQRRRLTVFEPAGLDGTRTATKRIFITLLTETYELWH
jgi:hypothetical protein